MAESSRPVLDINIDESRLKRMEEVVRKFQAALQTGPGGTPVPAGRSGAGGTQPTPGVTGRKQISPWAGDISKFLGSLDKSAQGTLKTFGLINKTLSATQSILKNLFSTTVTWSARLALMGGGGLFGYDVLSRHVAAQYRTAQGNNMTTGQMQAAQNVYGARISGIGNLIQGLTNAQNNPSDPTYAALLSMGINPEEGAGTGLPGLLSHVASLLKGYKKTGVSQAVLQSMGLGGMIDVNTANQIAANADDMSRLNAMFGVQAGQLDKDMGRGTQRNFQDLNGNLSYDADRIGNAFLSALSRLNKPVNSLADALTSDIGKFLNGPNGKVVFDAVADGLRALGAWLSGPDFQKDLSDFETAVKNITASVRVAIHWLDKLTGKEDESKNADQPAGAETSAQAIHNFLTADYKTSNDLASGLGHMAGVVFDNSVLSPMRDRAVSNAQKNQVDAENNAANTGHRVNPNDRHALNVLRSHITDANYRAGLPANMLSAIAARESSWDTRAVSKAGAAGLLGLMPATARGLGLSLADRFDPDKSAVAVTRYLRDNLRRYHGDIAETLAQYNGGNIAVGKNGNLNLKLETIKYLEDLIPKTGDGREQHAGLLDRLKTAEQQLHGNKDQRVVVQLEVGQRPGSDITASALSQYIPH
jgi:hypothetical protein